MTQKRKHAKPKKGIKNTDRRNGKAWKRGLPPAEREEAK